MGYCRFIHNGYLCYCISEMINHFLLSTATFEKIKWPRAALLNVMWYTSQIKRVNREPKRLCHAAQLMIPVDVAWVSTDIELNWNLFQQQQQLILLHYTIQIVEKRVNEVEVQYPYNCLTTYIKHLNSAIEGATTQFTCITIRHLIEKKRLWHLLKTNLYNNKQSECLI